MTCETNGLPAERWGVAVFRINEEAFVMEVSVEKDINDIMVSMMVDEKTNWRGMLKGLKQLIRITL
jgi:hypothetical protein